MAKTVCPYLGDKFISLSEFFDWLRSLSDDSVRIVQNMASNEAFLRRHGAEQEVGA